MRLAMLQYGQGRSHADAPDATLPREFPETMSFVSAWFWLSILIDVGTEPTN